MAVIILAINIPIDTLNNMYSIEGSVGSIMSTFLSDDKIATPSDSILTNEEYGYVTYEQDISGGDEVSLSGVHIKIYSDESCNSMVDELVLSFDGRCYENSNGCLTYFENKEELNECEDKQIRYARLLVGSYYYKIMDEYYEQDITLASNNIVFEENAEAFELTEKNSSKDDALILEIEVLVNTVDSTDEIIEATSTDAESEESEIQSAIGTAFFMLSSVQLMATSTNTGTTWSSVKSWIADNYTNNAGTSMACTTFVTTVMSHNTGFYPKGSSVSGIALGDTLYKTLVNTGYYAEVDEGYTGSKCAAESAARKALATKVSQYCIDNAEPGDILFFYDPTKTKTYGHTGIYTGNGNYVYSSGSQIRLGDSLANGKSIYTYIYYDDGTSTGYTGVTILHPMGGLMLLKRAEGDTTCSTVQTGAKFSIIKVDSNGDTSGTEYATAEIADESTSYTYEFSSGTTKKFWRAVYSVTSKGKAKGAYVYTNSNGNQILGLPTGWYYIKETSAPSGYEVDEAQWVKVTGSDTIKTVSTSKKVRFVDEKSATGYFNINKEGADTSVTNEGAAEEDDSYNMAGIIYNVYESDKSTDVSCKKEQYHNNKSTHRLVLSFDGVAYMDANGYNIVFSSASDKATYKESNNLYRFRWYNPEDLSSGSSVTYYVQESSVLLGNIVSNSYSGGSGVAYWYSASGTATDFITSRAGKSVKVTGYDYNSKYYKVTFTNSNNNITVSGVDENENSVVVGTYLYPTDSPLKGVLKLVKTSSFDVSKLEGTYYDMTGAEYTVYSEKSGNAVGKFTIQKQSETSYIGVPSMSGYTSMGQSIVANGVSSGAGGNYFILPLGTYTIKETKAPNNGYDTNGDTWTLVIDVNSSGSVIETLTKNTNTTIWNQTTNIYSVVIGNKYGNTTSGGTSAYSLAANTNEDAIHTGMLSLYKKSSDTEITADNCNYDMTGAEYTLYYYYNGSYQSVGTFTTAKGTGSDSDKYVGIPKRTTLGTSLGITVVSSETTVTTEKNYFNNLPFGMYKIEETTVPYGYEKDESIQVAASSGTTTNAFTLTESNYSVKVMATSTETPTYDPLAIKVQKKDSQTGEAVASGSGSLAGAQFTINYYAVSVDEITTYDELLASGATPTRTWVFETDEDGIIKTEDESYLVAGDELYMYDDKMVVPYGCITIEETKAPKGYTLDGAFINSENGETVSDASGMVFIPVVKGNTSSLGIYLGGSNSSVELIRNEVINRANLKLKKIDAETGKALSNIAFSLTSVTTGEKHILVTDENGVIDTSTIAHSSNTNANDKASADNYKACGIWFYGNSDLTGSIDDSLGALPCDKYILSEIKTDGNSGYVLIEDITIDLTDESLFTDGYYLLDLGNITNVPEPVIGTRAFAVSTGDNVIPADSEVLVYDEVSYSYLTAGKTYTVKGIIMDAETGLAYTDADGNYITGIKTFTVDSDYESYIEEKCGTVSVEYTIDTTGLAGKKLVVFEYLYEGGSTTELTVNTDGSIDEEGVYTTNTGKVIKHTDLKDENQTLTVETPVEDRVLDTFETREESDTSTPNESASPSVPKTGDNTEPFVVIVILVAALVLATILIISKRRAKRT